MGDPEVGRLDLEHKSDATKIGLDEWYSCLPIRVLFAGYPPGWVALTTPEFQDWAPLPSYSTGRFSFFGVFRAPEAAKGPLESTVRLRASVDGTREHKDAKNCKKRNIRGAIFAWITMKIGASAFDLCS